MADNIDAFLADVDRYTSDYLAALGVQGTAGQILVKSVDDKEFRARLLATPHEALKAEGVKLPEGLVVRVFENTDKQIHLVLPPAVE
jgi:hypothetical protein